MSDLPELPSPTDVNEIEAAEIIAKSEEREFSEAIAAIRERCQRAKLDFEDDEDSIGLWVELPAGRSKRSIWIMDLDEARDFLKHSFEDYSFLSGYNAIASFKEDFIEASIIGTTSQIRKYLFEVDPNERTEEESGLAPKNETTS